MTFKQELGFTANCAIGVVRGGSSMSAKFRIPRSMMEELGWAQETRVDVSWGSQEDIGRVLLLADNNGYAMAWPGRSRCAYFETARVPKGRLPTETHRLKNVDCEITPEGLVLDLPEFLMPPVKQAAE